MPSLPDVRLKVPSHIRTESLPRSALSSAVTVIAPPVITRSSLLFIPCPPSAATVRDPDPFIVRSQEANIAASTSAAIAASKENGPFSGRSSQGYAIYAGDFLNEVGFRKLFEAMYKDISYELSYYGPLIGIRPEAYRHEVEYVDKWAKGRMDEFMRQLCEFYKLETPIPLTINIASSENMLVGLTFNDHQLSEARYNGRYFKNHPIRLAAQAVDGKVVAGWCINRTDGKGLSVVERQGATLIMPMPDCDRLTIEPIFKEADDASLSIQ